MYLIDMKIKLSKNNRKKKVLV